MTPCPTCHRPRNHGHNCKGGRLALHEGLTAFEAKARAELARGVVHYTDPADLARIEAEILASRSPFRTHTTGALVYADRRKAGGWRRR